MQIKPTIKNVPFTPMNYLESRYEEIATITNDLERNLLEIIIRNVKAKEEPEKELFDKTKRLSQRFKAFYSSLHAIQDCTIQFINNITLQESLKYRFQIINGYCFFFHANQLLNYILDNDFFPDNWQDINSALIKVYPHFYKEIHASKKYELYFAQTVILMLQEICRNPFFFNDEMEVTRLQLTLKLYYDFLKRINNPKLKAPCYLYLFVLESNHLLRSSIELVNQDNLRESNFYAQQILSHLDKMDASDNKIFNFIAEGTVFHNQMQILNCKIINSCSMIAGQSVQSFFKDKMSLNIKNERAVYNFLQKIIDASKLKEAINFLDELSQQKENIFIEKIFQTKELATNLVTPYRQTLETCNGIIASIIEKNQLDNTKDKLFYDFVYLCKDILCLSIKLDSINNTLGGDSCSESLLQELDKIICEITTYEEKQKICEEKYLALQNESTNSHDRKKQRAIKKALKEKHIREAYRKEINNISGANENIKTDSIDELIQKANLKFSQGILEDALTLYQHARSNDNSKSIRSINNIISLGDVYKALSQEDEKLEKKYALTAIAYYREAEKLAEECLSEQLPLELKTEFKTIYEIAKSSADNLTSKTAFIEKSKNKRKSLPSISDFNINATTLIRQIPLPKAFQEVYQFLKENNYYVFIVGGFVRDYFLNKNPFDIDIIIFDKQLKCCLEPLSNLLDLIKSKFEGTSIRSKKHSILYLEYKNTIIEISTPKVTEELIKKAQATQEEEEFQTLLTEIIYSDAKHRDTTDNAIFYYIQKQQIIDFFDGIKHIKENKLVSINTPDMTFSEDATRIFRVLRSIINRSLKNPYLVYSDEMIASMKKYAEKIYELNKDRCYSEIYKLLFRGNALPSWEFFNQIGFISYLTLLPSEKSNLQLKHSIMVKRALSNLDNRIKNNIPYNEALVFSILLWGAFLEKVEILLKEANKAHIKHFILIANELLEDKKLVFKLPYHLCKEIKSIWFVYLSTHILKVEGVKIDYHNYRLAYVFAKVVSYARDIAPEEKVKQLFSSNKYTFFKGQKLEYYTKEFVRSNKFFLNKNCNHFSISLEDNVISPLDKLQLIQKLKKNLQIICGKYAIHYQLLENGIKISTKSVLLYHSIAAKMRFIFDEGIKDEVLRYIPI